MEKLESREVLRIVGMVERLNRHAVAIGQNGKIRGAKSVIQLKPIGEHEWHIWISISTNLDGQRYDVAAIQKLRANFVHEGKLTIELRQPPLNLMLRDCKADDLSFFFQKLQYIKKTFEEDRGLKRAHTDMSKEEDKGLKRAHTDMAKEEERGLKRTHTDMSNKEAASLRKVLRLHTTNLVVTERSEYPLRGFPTDLQRIVLQGIQLKRVDGRLSELLHLKILSLENNRIVSIEPLANLKSCLETLNVSDNQIEVISESLFRSKGLCKLQQLSMNRNQLKVLPNSICGLQNLRDLQVCSNSLLVLPFNMHRLQNLTCLKVNDNKLKSLPFPISRLKLHHLDVSSNPLANNIDETPRKVQFENEPTLFELAGGALLSHIYKETMNLKGGSNEAIAIDVFDTSIVPRSISDHLNTSKYCYRCGDMHLRYTLLYNQTRHDFAINTVNSLVGGFIPTCKAVCDRCLTLENVVA